VLHRKDYSLPRHAECIFIGGDQPEKFVNKLIKIRLQANSKVEMKMRLKSLSALPLLWLKHMNLPQKLAEYRQYASPEAGLAHYASSVGIDLPSLQMMKRFLIKRAIALLRQ
jgi:hypothetical protein